MPDLAMLEPDTLHTSELLFIGAKFGGVSIDDRLRLSPSFIPRTTNPPILPNDILVLVFKSLLTESGLDSNLNTDRPLYRTTLLSAASVSRTWNHTVVTVIYKRVRITCAREWTSFLWTLEHSELGALIESLHVGGFDPLPTENKRRSRRFGRTSPPRVYKDTLTDAIITRCVNLRRLSIDLPSYKYHWSTPPRHSRDYISRIEALKIGPSTDAHWLIDALAEGTLDCSNLYDLSLSGASAFSARATRTWSELPRLRKLELARCTILSADLIQLLTRAAPTLTDLTLSHILLSPTSFRDKPTISWPYLPDLQRLTLTDISGLNGEARLSDFFPSTPALRELHIARILFEHEEWDDQPRPPRLKRLTLGTQHLSYPSINSLFSLLTKPSNCVLTELSVYDDTLVRDPLFLPPLLLAAPTLTSLALLREAHLPIGFLPVLPSFTRVHTLRAVVRQSASDTFLLHLPPSIRILDLRCTMSGLHLQGAFRSLFVTHDPFALYPHLKEINIVTRESSGREWMRGWFRERWIYLGLRVKMEARDGMDFFAP